MPVNADGPSTDASALADGSRDSDRYDPTVPPPSPGVYDLGDVTRLDVSFPSDGFRLAGHLYLPPTPAPRGRRRAGVVLDGPMMSIKEFSVPVYAIRLARAGYTVLTFDRRDWGGSEGPVGHQHMNPPDNVRDIRNATTYLLSRDDIDPERVAGVGVCFGGGFMLQAGALDRRYQVLACIGAFFGAQLMIRDNLGYDGWIEHLRTLRAGRLADFRAGRTLAYQAFAPSSAPEGTALASGDEPYHFYTSRHRELAPDAWVNELTQESMQNIAEYDATVYAPLVAPTPLLVVHGTVDPYAPPRYAQQVHDTAGDPKSLVWVETTNHVQIYDIEPHVGQATTALVDWLAKHMPA